MGHDHHDHHDHHGMMMGRAQDLAREGEDIWEEEEGRVVWGKTKDAASRGDEEVKEIMDLMSSMMMHRRREGGDGGERNGDDEGLDAVAASRVGTPVMVLIQRHTLGRRGGPFGNPSGDDDADIVKAAIRSIRCPRMRAYMMDKFKVSDVMMHGGGGRPKPDVGGDVGYVVGPPWPMGVMKMWWNRVMDVVSSRFVREDRRDDGGVTTWCVSWLTRLTSWVPRCLRREGDDDEGHPMVAQKIVLGEDSGTWRPWWWHAKAQSEYAAAMAKQGGDEILPTLMGMPGSAQGEGPTHYKYGVDWSIWDEDGSLNVSMLLFFGLLGACAAVWFSLVLQMIDFCFGGVDSDDYYDDDDAQYIVVATDDDNVHSEYYYDESTGIFRPLQRDFKEAGLVKGALVWDATKTAADSEVNAKTPPSKHVGTTIKESK